MDHCKIMNCFKFYFKRKLSVFSLVFLVSFLCTNIGFTALHNQDGQEQKFENPISPKQKLLTLDSVKVLILKAKAGDIHAQDELMEIFYRGLYRIFLTPETIDFISWKSQGPENNIQNRCFSNDIYAFFAIYHFEKIGTQFTRLFETAKERAERGIAAAQNNLGFMYAEGRIVKQDYKEAFKYYKLAADQGLSPALGNLGNLYLFGRTVKQDYKEAFKYFKLAADQGEAIAQSYVGLLYLAGLGVKQNHKEAFKYYMLAADQGYDIAQSHVGAMYLKGTDVKQDYKEAFKYFKLAADQGWAIAQYELGEIYLKGTGVKQDYKEAFKYFKLAADQGYAIAQYKISNMYAEGIGVDKSYLKAIYWIIKDYIGRANAIFQ